MTSPSMIPADPAETVVVTAGSRASGPQGHGGARQRSRGLPWYAVVLVALVAGALVRGLLVESFYVPDRGMEPTLGAGDRVLVTKWSRAPERGEVVVADVRSAFDGPERGSPTADGVIGRVLGWGASVLGVASGSRLVMDRVVAVGGDEVSCSPEGRVLVGEHPVSDAVGCSGLSVQVPVGSVWLLGDSPAHASDSLSQVRDGAPGQGLIPAADIVGRVRVALWPPGLVGNDIAVTPR